jgi:hypothetical protein
LLFKKKSILPFIISATGIVPQSLFKNLKFLDLGNTLVVEIEKGILLYSCHIVRKFLNIDTEHNTVRSKKKIRVGADQTFQLEIREISINRCQS